MKDVYTFLKSLKIKDDDTLVVAVSYGPDSMFLLHLLKKKYAKNKIVCCHVHHNHRKESDLEAKELKKYCLLNDIIFEFMKIDSYKNNKFTEEEARNKRYKFFDEILTKYDSKYLFTAHHGDDLVETILMKISRGSSFKGYSGISLISNRKNYKIIRPLLYLTKEDILNMCKLNNIPFAVDKSNLSDDYKRNRYRKYILPKLKEENKLIHRKFLQFSSEVDKYNNYVEKIANDCFKNIVKDNEINIDLLLKQNKLIIEKVIEKYLFLIYKDDINKITNIHKKNIYNLIYSTKPNLKLSMPNKINIIKSYNKLYFDKEFSYNNDCVMFSDKVKLPNGYIIEKVKNLDNTTNFVTCLKKTEIDLPIYVRKRHNGDRMEVLNLNGSKKIKDILIDDKVPLSIRNASYVVTDKNDNIIWLPGIKKSKYDRSKTGNYDIILKYYKEEYNDKSK